MRILFMGTPDFAVPCLEHLLKSDHEVIGVLTQPDKPQGRKQILTPPPVKVLAVRSQIPVYQPETLKNNAILDILQESQPDLIVVVAYGKILPKYVLEFPRYGCINVHGSLLPKWRGAAPIQWSILSGEQITGITTMRMAEGLDTGDILLKAQIQIEQTDTAGSLFEKLSKLGADLLDKTISQLDTITPTPQDEQEATYASILSKQMAEIDWSKSAQEIHCQIRGFNPWPIAWTRIGETTMKIYAASCVSATGEMGTVLEASANKGLCIACGNGALWIEELQMVGGKRMRATDYLRGHQILVGTKLGRL